MEEEKKTERTVGGIFSDLAVTTKPHNPSPDDDGSHGDTDSGEFTPVVHPVEPSGDDDRPVECPMPETSFLFFEDEEDRFGITNPRKRVEISTETTDNNKNNREQQQQRVHKRHQSQKGTPGNTYIFQIFNQCKT